MDKLQDIIDSRIQAALGAYNRTSLRLPRHIHNGSDSLQIDPRNLINYPTIVAPNVIVIVTNGTTPIKVFPDGLPFDLKYTSMMTISVDTTAANILLTNNGNSVALIAKGTTAGGVVGAPALSNQMQARGTPATIVSSSAGNAFVIIYFTAL